MLRMALNVEWKQRKTNKEIYGNLPRATMKIQERRMRIAGQIHRHPEVVANRLLLWEPTHRVRNWERPAIITYVDSLRLRADTGLNDAGGPGSSWKFSQNRLFSCFLIEESDIYELLLIP